MLPDRFDEDGRPLDRGGRSRSRGAGAGDPQQEMVEKLTRDFGDVVSGKKSFKDLLMGVVTDLGGAGSLEGSAASKSPQRSRRRRRDKDRD